MKRGRKKAARAFLRPGQAESFAKLLASHEHLVESSRADLRATHFTFNRVPSQSARTTARASPLQPSTNPERG